jgi:P4 family phage/plasmid primase-like protien
MYAAHVDFKKQTRQNVDQVVDNILSKSRNLNEDKMYEQRRVINVLNGAVFITKNGKFTFVNEHRKKDAATNILAFDYDAKAKAPKWRKFLNRVLPEVEDQHALMEFMGYCFMPSHKFETFLFLFGKSGANGKSVILDTIKRFFGDDNVSGLQLQQLEGHQLQALTNKILNIGSEIDKTGTDKGQLATLKQLVSPEDPVQINPKNDKPYLLLSNEKPKMAFSGNDKPRNGLDNAIFRRMLLLSFDTEIKDDEKIRGLSDRFNDEMAGIFNMALEGMERLVRNGKFTRSKRMKQELEEYKDEVNPLRTFIRDALIKDKKIMVPSQYVYALYRAYIFNAGGKPQKDSNFWKGIKEELVSEGHKTELKQIRLKQPMLGLGERTRCALHIGVNKDFEISSISMDGNIMVETANMNIAVDNSLPIEDIDE